MVRVGGSGGVGWAQWQLLGIDEDRARGEDAHVSRAALGPERWDERAGTAHRQLTDRHRPRHK
jgi:hypothetical protein